ncbi:MAG: hypothetical protein ABI884_07990 [Gemmatimonadota bacterium]
MSGGTGFPALSMALTNSFNPSGNSLRIRLNAALSASIDFRSTPIGLMTSPSDFQWLSDTAVVFDGLSSRAYFFDLNGKVIRILTLPHPFSSAALDPNRMRAYLAIYSSRYYYADDRFVPGSDSLIEETSLIDGRALGSIGTPVQYGHAKLQFLGNDVMLARDPKSGSLAVAWPVSPHVEIRGVNNRLHLDLPYSGNFTPPQPKVVQLAPLPMPPDVDYQRIVYGMDVDSAGRIYLLTASTLQTEPIWSSKYHPPHEVVEVMSASGETICRIPLPFFATAVAVARQGQLLLSDSARGNGAYRLTYKCLTVGKKRDDN